MTLYEIDQAILDCLDFETGEVIYPIRLDELQMEREAKVENVALWIKNLEADAMVYEKEANAFIERADAAVKKAERLREWLANALNGQRFSTARCDVSFRTSERLEIAAGTKLPKEFMVETVTAKPDKLAIKRRLKDGGEVVGCSLVKRLNTQIK